MTKPPIQKHRNHPKSSPKTPSTPFPSKPNRKLNERK